MGGGCASTCNSRRNRLPRAIEENSDYFELTDETQNERKRSLDQRKCSWHQHSIRNPTSQEMSNTKSNTNQSCPYYCCKEKIDLDFSPPGNCAFIGDPIQDMHQTPFPNIGKEDYVDRSKHSITSCKALTSCKLRGVNIDTLSVDCHDSEAAQGEQMRNFDNEVSYALWNNKHLEQKCKQLDASNFKVSNPTVNLRGGSSPLWKSSKERQNKKLPWAARRDDYLNESDLTIETQKWSNPNGEKQESFKAKVNTENNPFDKTYNNVMVCNPGSCIFPTLVEEGKKIHISGSSDVVSESRANYVKWGMSKMSSDESCTRVTLEEVNKRNYKSSRNRESCSDSCEAREVWVNINQRHKNKSFDDFCDEEAAELSKEDSKNSLSMLSETTLFREMDRCLAISPTSPPESGGKVHGKNELPFVREENTWMVGDVSKIAHSATSSDEYLAEMINEALESLADEKNNLEMTSPSECDDSFLNSSIQFCSAHEQKSSDPVEEEMSQNLDNKWSVGVATLYPLKVEMAAASEISQNSRSASGKLPSTIVSEGPSTQEFSVCSVRKSVFEGKNYLTKYPPMHAVEEWENQWPNNDNKSFAITSGKPDQNTVAVTSPQFKPEENQELQYSFNGSKRSPAVSAKSYQSVTSPHKKWETSQTPSIDLIDSPTSSWDIEDEVKDILSAPKILAREVSKWTVQDVQQWIMQLNSEVGHYSGVFKTFNIDGELLLLLTPEDFGRFIQNKMHRQVVMNALEKICQSTWEISWKSTKGYLQRYQLKKLIKIGRFSTTYLARDVENGNRICAVKLISSEKSKNLRHPEIAAKEVALKEWLATSSSMHHKNMIKYYEHSSNEIYRGTLWKYVIVREHHQLNLELLVTNGIALGERISRLILHQIVSLLCFFRVKQIAHFDVQPLNLLVTRDKWRIKLTDWGSFKQFTTQSTHRDGALELDFRSIYSAPEIYNNDEYGLTAESWSLGVILFGLITGTELFSSRKRDAVYNSLKKDSFKAFSRSLGEKMSWPLPGTTKAFIFSLVRYNAGERLDIQNVKNCKYYTGVLPSDEEYKLAMEIAFDQFLSPRE